MLLQRNSFSKKMFCHKITLHALLYMPLTLLRLGFLKEVSPSFFYHSKTLFVLLKNKITLSKINYKYFSKIMLHCRHLTSGHFIIFICQITYYCHQHPLSAYVQRCNQNPFKHLRWRVLGK